MPSNIAQALSLRFPPLGIFYAQESPAEAKDLKPLCSIPRAVIGLTDISARFYLRKILGKDILSFTVPRSLFEEMEGNVSESFLTRFAWKSMMGK
jgi:hypothetical protein